MEALIVIALISIVVFFAVRANRKREIPEVKPSPMQDLKLKVANLETKGRDYQVFIISENEWNDKSKEIDKWLRSKFEDKEGIYILPEINEKGLYEFTYKTTGGVIWDILLLLVDSTSKPIIPIEPPEHIKEIVYVNGKAIEIWDDPIIIPHEHRETLDVFDIVINDDGGDLTNQILDQINAVPDGTEDRPNVIKFPKGRFRTEGDLANNYRGIKHIFHLFERKNLILEGHSENEYTEFYTTAPAVPYENLVHKNQQSERRHIMVENCYNIKGKWIKIGGSDTTEGYKLEPNIPVFWKGGSDQGSLKGFPGYHAPWEGEHAFAVHDSEHTLFEECEVDGVWGDGFYVGNGHPIGSTHTIFRNMKVRRAGRQGGAASQCQHLLIENVEFIECRRASIDLEPHAKWLKVNYVKIRNCKLHAMMVPIAAVGNGDVSKVLIENCEYSGGNFVVCYDSLKIQRRNTWIVRNNKRTNWFGSPAADIDMEMIDDVLIYGNTLQVHDQQSKRTAYFPYCKNIEFRENNVGSATIIHADLSEITASGNTPEQELIQLNYI